MADHLAGVPPERIKRLHAVLTGRLPVCPECGEVLEDVAARYRAAGARDAYWGAIQLVRKAMIDRWTMAQLAESLQAVYDAARQDAERKS